MAKDKRPAHLISDDEFIAAMRPLLITPEEQSRLVQEFTDAVGQCVQKARGVVRGNGFIMIDSIPQ